jgi:hypothetical protein
MLDASLTALLSASHTMAITWRALSSALSEAARVRRRAQLRRLMLARALGLIARAAIAACHLRQSGVTLHTESLSPTKAPERLGRNVRSSLRSAIGQFSGPC